MENLINEMYAEILEKKAYLNSTDYLIIKDSELGCGVDVEVLQKRSDARDRINAIELEITKAEVAEIKLQEYELSVL